MLSILIMVLLLGWILVFQSFVFRLSFSSSTSNWASYHMCKICKNWFELLLERDYGTEKRESNRKTTRGSPIGYPLIRGGSQDDDCRRAEIICIGVAFDVRALRAFFFRDHIITRMIGRIHI